MRWKQTDGGKEGKWETRVKPVWRNLLNDAAFMLDGKNVRAEAAKSPHSRRRVINVTAQRMWWKYQPQNPKNQQVVTSCCGVLTAAIIKRDFQYMVSTFFFFMPQWKYKTVDFTLGGFIWMLRSEIKLKYEELDTAKHNKLRDQIKYLMCVWWEFNQIS